MNLSEKELKVEEKYLQNTARIIDAKISKLGQTMFDNEEKITEFKRYIWVSKQDLDPQEMRQVMVQNNMQVFFLEKDARYFRNLYKIRSNPYFGSIKFNDGKTEEDIYIGITYLEDENSQHLIYDWRSPISSLFYDYEVGPCEYNAPGGIYTGTMKRKRQYKIEDRKIIHIFDNNVNVEDELLQEVLANDSDEKMKNIVNTIASEQNKIIRNSQDKNLIVQGIAGSGKTSVALHRIAFLLYRIKELTSSGVLIFSPNNIFTEYISKVLPELGEDNTKQATFNDFLKTYIREYKKVETFTDFIARFYKYEESNPELVRYKQSDEIINDIENYVSFLETTIRFDKDIEEAINFYSKVELNDMFCKRYSRFNVVERIDAMADNMSRVNYRGSIKKKPTYKKLLKESLNLKFDYKEIYQNFYQSSFCKIKLSDEEINSFIKKDNINYEDAVLLVYLKCLLEGFPYNNEISQVVIDEAQDYTKLQFKIISKIFKKSAFTILGDTNQTINPYYKYDFLSDITHLFTGNTKYAELNKTYRSSKEIIDYANEILDLNFVSAIRRGKSKPVIFKEETDLKNNLFEDLSRLQKEYRSTAIITKSDEEANRIYNILKKELNVSLITGNTTTFKKNLIIIPAYIAKGLEFDSVIVYNDSRNKFKEKEKYLYYVAITRAQHELIIYNK